MLEKTPKVNQWRRDFLIEVFILFLSIRNKIIVLEMHLISRLRDDADLRYLFKGEPIGNKGSPRKEGTQAEYYAVPCHL